ncbi:MAG: methylmalonyl-CoA mutase subunit beta [Dokdonia sp.]|jgi:methylmalonyl-CoA mutase
MKKTDLFTEFESYSAKAFKQQIQYDLKGASYNDTLLWSTNEGIDIKPFYHSDEQTQVLAVPGLPQQWHIGEAIYISDPVKAASLAQKAITGGATLLFFTAAQPFDIEMLLDDVITHNIPMYFELQFLNPEFYAALSSYAFAKAVTITITLDPIAHLIEDGNWYVSMPADLDHFTQIISSKENRGITIDLRQYQNAGATMTQQLAYGLGQLNEYLHLIEEKGGSPSKITYTVAVGSHYFFEIAKLRALRQLTAVLLEAHKELLPDVDVAIIAHPSKRNKTLYDYNTNMLRTTTEAMSAILGGANAVVNMPYDAIYHKTNDFGQRIARNQLIILKEESYFEAVSNPASGSYYVEAITEKLASNALSLFKTLEENGGLLRQLKDGVIQRKIKESADREQQQFDQGELILLGTNKHPNPDDTMQDTIELYPFLKIKPRKTIIVPIITKRLSESLEQQRLATENNK